MLIFMEFLPLRELLAQCLSQCVHPSGGQGSARTARPGVRVSIGPEFGTVGPEWIQEAAKEALKGSRCELLLVCGFAFDPHVATQTEELKKQKDGK